MVFRRDVACRFSRVRRPRESVSPTDVRELLADLDCVRMILSTIR